MAKFQVKNMSYWKAKADASPTKILGLAVAAGKAILGGIKKRREEKQAGEAMQNQSFQALAQKKL